MQQRGARQWLILEPRLETGEAPIQEVACGKGNALRRVGSGRLKQADEKCRHLLSALAFASGDIPLGGDPARLQRHRDSECNQQPGDDSGRSEAGRMPSRELPRPIWCSAARPRPVRFAGGA